MSKEYTIYNVESEMFQCNKHYPNCIGFWLNWDANVGFGRLSFIYNTKTKEWMCDSKYMSEELCKAVLDKWLQDTYGHSRDICQTKEVNNSKPLDNFENEKIQNAMICAARNANLSKEEMVEIFRDKGIMKVYNLGMKHMYNYLKNEKK